MGWRERSARRTRSATATPYLRSPRAGGPGRLTPASLARLRPKCSPTRSCARLRRRKASAACPPLASSAPCRRASSDRRAGSPKPREGGRPPRLPLSLHLTLLVVYSVVIVALGLWTARLIRGSSDF